jgi:hypothetical protein
MKLLQTPQWVTLWDTVEEVIMSAEDIKTLLQVSVHWSPYYWMQVVLTLVLPEEKVAFFHNLLRVQNTVSEESRVGLGACESLLEPQVFHGFGHHLTWEFDKREIKSTSRQFFLSLFKWWVVSSLRRSLVQNLNMRNFRHCLTRAFYSRK